METTSFLKANSCAQVEIATHASGRFKGGATRGSFPSLEELQRLAPLFGNCATLLKNENQVKSF